MRNTFAPPTPAIKWATNVVVDEDFTDLAIGLSAGFKAVSIRGFVAEVYLGIGRDLLGNSDLELVTRGGISLGYRF